MKISTSLIISTYNTVNELELVLMSALKLKKKPTEILIADDGSDDRTKQLIQSFQEKFNIQLKNFWHQDEGFRKAIILNQAIAKSTSDYIIQIDGDCIMHPNFITDHLNRAKKDLFLYGSRVRIKESYRNELFKSKKIKFSFFSKGIKKRPRSIYAPKLNTYKPSLEIPNKFRGANCSYWKKDFIKVNGYNEDFKGWGREDSELIIRFLNNGIKGKRLKFEAIVYHIDHKERSRNFLDKNDEIQTETIEQKKLRCENGIDKYL